MKLQQTAGSFLDEFVEEIVGSQEGCVGGKLQVGG